MSDSRLDYYEQVIVFCHECQREWPCEWSELVATQTAASQHVCGRDADAACPATGGVHEVEHVSGPGLNGWFCIECKHQFSPPQPQEPFMTQNAKLPPKCKHCKAREPLDADGFCVDYDACVERKPLAGTSPPEVPEQLRGGQRVSERS